MFPYVCFPTCGYQIFNLQKYDTRDTTLSCSMVVNETCCQCVRQNYSFFSRYKTGKSVDKDADNKLQIMQVVWSIYFT